MSTELHRPPLQWHSPSSIANFIEAVCSLPLGATSQLKRSHFQPTEVSRQAEQQVLKKVTSHRQAASDRCHTSTSPRC